ncbi:PTS glucose transporter subunit IIA, partial [Bacillus altitudinis]|uniref:PTS glucose transporter subunit IIA n=1 Tax=Bacillus altitudinis TaxID=293387 RepID=UPI003B52E1FE
MFPSPVTPHLHPITDVPHQLFSPKIIRHAFPIFPKEATLLSPLTRKILNLFPTKHPIHLHSHPPLQIFIHFPIHTLTLK